MRKGQEKKKRTTKVAPERMNLDDMSSDEEEAGDAPAPAQQPQDGVVSQREAEKILAEAEQRLEDECREMLDDAARPGRLGFRGGAAPGRGLARGRRHRRSETGGLGGAVLRRGQ